MSTSHSKLVRASGSCLCGAVRYRVYGAMRPVVSCHCNMCRQWGGSPTHSVHCGTDVSFTNPEYISVYQSCDWAELGFCKNCGSHLFYRLLEGGDYVLSTGSFVNSDAFELKQQIFIEEKPAYYSYANETENLTGEQVFAMYAQNQE